MPKMKTHKGSKKRFRVTAGKSSSAARPARSTCSATRPANASAACASRHADEPPGPQVHRSHGRNALSSETRANCKQEFYWEIQP